MPGIKPGVDTVLLPGGNVPAPGTTRSCRGSSARPGAGWSHHGRLAAIDDQGFWQDLPDAADTTMLC
jgi:hypothetical protein